MRHTITIIIIDRNSSFLLLHQELFKNNEEENGNKNNESRIIYSGWQSLPRRSSRNDGATSTTTMKSHHDLSASLDEISNLSHKESRSKLLSSSLSATKLADHHTTQYPLATTLSPLATTLSPLATTPSPLATLEEAAFELKKKSSVSLNNVRTKLSRSVVELQLYWSFSVIKFIIYP